MAVLADGSTYVQAEEDRCRGCLYLIKRAETSNAPLSRLRSTLGHPQCWDPDPTWARPALRRFESGNLSRLRARPPSPSNSKQAVKQIEEGTGSGLDGSSRAGLQSSVQGISPRRLPLIGSSLIASGMADGDALVQETVEFRSRGNSPTWLAQYIAGQRGGFGGIGRIGGSCGMPVE